MLMEGKKLLRFLALLWSVFCLTECVSRNDVRRRRRETCPDGTYTASGKSECCFCPKGSYLVKDCVSPGTAPQCVTCENGTYRDRANSERNCEPCRKCGINDNKIEVRSCSKSSNAVCGCQNAHYCDKGSECKVCYACSTCDEFGVKVPCNLTNNTQCNEGPAVGSGTIAVIVCVVLIILGMFTVVAFLLWKKGFCLTRTENPENPEALELLDDTDLQEMLPKISELLGFRVVRTVVRRQGLSQTIIDNIMDENPQDVSEQAYQLLKAWYEKHGMKGASRALWDNLIQINGRRKAEQVQELIKQELGNREAEKQNGHD